VGAFEYTALDPAGKERKGVLEGDNPRAVRQMLRDKQLLPISVLEVGAQEATRQKQFSFGRGASSTDVALLTRQLATLARAGIPLEEALLAVSQQTEKPRISSILMGVRAKVLEGHTLGAGLAEFPRVFPEIYRSTVAAGEQAGHLDRVLERLADYTENRDQLKQKILAAMLYPIVLTVVCLFVVAGLMVYVVPKVVDVFESSKAQLPMITRVLIAVSDFLRHYGIWLVLILVIAGIAFWRWIQNRDARVRFHAWTLHVPLFGRLIRGFNNARFARTFSILTASSVPVLEAMRIAGEVVTNLPMRDAVTAAAQRVREGAPIGRSLGQSKLFPPMTIHLISSGESSGELEDMLDRASVSQERELDSLIAGVVGLLGPALVVLMGGFVLAIVFAMLLPIFEMNTLIR
jgi:general secretion pathway protein F